MASPFKRVLVPYDGSPPAALALEYALRLGRQGAALTVLTAVNQVPVIAQSSTSVTAFDPTPLLDALDEQGRDLLAAAQQKCRDAILEPSIELSHEPPVPAILDAIREHSCDLVVMGTHARQGLQHMFIGSTTEGVLRLSEVPVLTVREETRADSERPFHRALIAVDDSDPADAAVRLALEFATAFGTELVLCNVIDTRDLYAKAATYGYDPEPLLDELRAHARSIAENCAKHAGSSTTPHDVTLVEGEPAAAIAQAASDQRADLILIGSHGRRGLRRLFLGSVAEHVVRVAHVPVLVVRR